MLDLIKAELRVLFGDTSVTSSETRAALEEIRDLVEDMIDILPEESDDA
ncbi:hypothetical protein G3A39_42480 [Paraburkholderia aspalathi]|nr:hypothetical protein [Paraburkholderia aspalathi]